MAITSVSDAAPKCRKKHTLVASSAMEVLPGDAVVSDKKAKKAEWKKARMERRQERRKAHHERKKAKFEGRGNNKEEHGKGRNHGKALGLKKSFHFGGKPFVVDAATAVPADEQNGTKEKPFATLDQALAKAQEFAKKENRKHRPVRIVLKSGTYFPEGDKDAFEVQAPLSLTIVCSGDVTIAKPIKWTAEKTEV